MTIMLLSLRALIRKPGHDVLKQVFQVPTNKAQCRGIMVRKVGTRYLLWLCEDAPRGSWLALASTGTVPSQGELWSGRP